jgi:hypothetical protein
MATTSVTTNSTGLTVTSGNIVSVTSGATVTSATVSSGGTLIITSGTDAGGTILLGGQEVVSGIASGDNIYGSQLVSGSGATVSNETVFGGGTVELGLAGVVGTGITVSNSGTLLISGRGSAVSATLDSGGQLILDSAKATLTGGVVLSGPATIYVDAVISPGITGSAFGDQAAPISGFSTGDVIDDTAVSYTGATLTTTTSGGVVTATLSGGTFPQIYEFAGIVAGNLHLTSDGNGGAEITYVACYAAGTLIRTGDGEAAVETLRPGSLVVTVDGTVEPVRWVGRRRYAGRALLGRRHLMPVCIKAGALAPQTPRRDLLVSPLHAMLLDGVLVPAKELVNGTTIVQLEDRTEIEYVHIELDRHTAVWAEGAASETFVDDDSRFVFQSCEGTPVSTADTARFFAPRIEHGFALEAIRRKLAARAAGVPV